jgi:hypothetical protein
MQKARMEYLHADNYMIKKKVQHNDEAHSRLLRVAHGKEEQHRMLREMIQKYEHFEKRRLEKGSNEHPKTEEDEHILPVNKKSTLPKVEKKAHHLIDVKASKRLYHPNSKLLIINEERQKDFLGLAPNIVDPKLTKRTNEDPKEFSLQIRSALPLKNKKLFSKYYTGGPPEYEYDSNSVCC